MVFEEPEEAEEHGDLPGGEGKDSWEWEAQWESRELRWTRGVVPVVHL